MRRLYRMTSLRGRLTVWSVVTLALALAACALAVHLIMRASLLASVDRDLAREAGAALAQGPQNKIIYQKTLGRSPHEMVRLIIPSGAGPERTVLRKRRTEERQIRQTTELKRVDVPLPREILPLITDRHRFMVVRLWNGQGAVRPPLSGADLPDRSIWERQFTLARDRKRYATLMLDGQPWRVLTTPGRLDGSMMSMVQVAYPLQEIYSLLRSLDSALLALIAPALLLTGAGCAWLTGRALRPVSRIAHAAMEVEACDLSRRLPVTGGDEMALLATTFNSMFDRLQTAFAQMEATVERQRRFTADASHELRTPLTTMRANADWALRRPRAAVDYQEALRAIVEAADRTDQLIESLLFLARSDSGRLDTSEEAQCLTTLLRHVIDHLPLDANAAVIELDLPGRLPPVRGDAEQLERLFTNLLQNALRHTPASGVIRIEADEIGSDLEITVADTGEGIPAEHLPHVSERFYRVDAARARPGGGAGLGLAICQSIVERHGGAMRIESTVGAGTKVHVRLRRYVERVP